jgi:hypothetical protein
MEGCLMDEDREVEYISEEQAQDLLAGVINVVDVNFTIGRSTAVDCDCGLDHTQERFFLVDFVTANDLSVKLIIYNDVPFFQQLVSGEVTTEVQACLARLEAESL